MRIEHLKTRDMVIFLTVVVILLANIPTGLAYKSITVERPNGGEIWVRGTINIMTWSYTGDIDSVGVYLWKGDSPYRRIVFNILNRGSYYWSIPYYIPIDSDYRIRIIGGLASDLSDDYFTVAGLEVRYPNGREIWPRRTMLHIRWIYIGYPGPNVRIELWKGDSYHKTISANTSNDENYYWNIPYDQSIGTDYKIKIYSLSDFAYRDMSNNFFTIGGIDVKAPNGAEYWPRGSNHNITWTSYGNPGPDVAIELWKNGMFNRTIVDSTPNDGRYYWSILSNQSTGTDYKIKIYSTSNNIYRDMSHNDFTIV